MHGPERRLVLVRRWPRKPWYKISSYDVLRQSLLDARLTFLNYYPRTVLTNTRTHAMVATALKATLVGSCLFLANGFQVSRRGSGSEHEGFIACHSTRGCVYELYHLYVAIPRILHPFRG